MKKHFIRAAALLAVVVSITSCSTSSRLTWVKTHPATQPVTSSEKSRTENNNMTVLPAPNEGVQAGQPSDLAITPIQTHSVSNSPAHHNNVVALNTVKHKKGVFHAIAQKAIIKHITTAGPMSNIDPDLRTALILIIIGIVLSIFWVLPGIGILLGIIGDICFLIGVILLILYLLS